MDDRVDTWWRNLAIEYRRVRRLGALPTRERQWLVDVQIFLTRDLPEVPVNA